MATHRPLRSGWLLPEVRTPVIESGGGRGAKRVSQEPCDRLLCPKNFKRVSVQMERVHTWPVAVWARTTRMRGQLTVAFNIKNELGLWNFVTAATFPRGPDGMWTGTLVCSPVYNNKSLQTAEPSQKGSGK